MPRKKNQSADASSSGRDSTEKVPKDNEVQLRWRENTLVELQNMFTGSIDPEVVQLVLSESSYNVNDAVEKLFVLSGIEQGQMESEAIPDSHPSKSYRTSSSSLENQKSNYYHGVSNAGQLTHKVDSHSDGPQAGASSGNFNSSVLKNSSTLTSKGKIAHNSPYSTSGDQHQGKVPRSLLHYKPTSEVFYGASGTVSSEGEVLPDVCTDNTSFVTSSGLPEFPDNIAQQFDSLSNQANPPYAGLLCSKKPTIHQGDMQSEDLKPPAGLDHCELNKAKPINLPIHDQELKGNLELFIKQETPGSTGTEETKKISLGCSEKEPLDFEFNRKQQQLESSSPAGRTDNTNPRVPCSESQRTSNYHNYNDNYLNYHQNNPKTSLKHNEDTPQFQHKTTTFQQLQPHHDEKSKSKETMSQPPAVQRQIHPYLPPQGFSQMLNVSHQRFPFMQVRPAAWQQGLATQRFPGHVPTQYLQGPFSMHPNFSFGAPPTAVTRPIRHGFGVRGPLSSPTQRKLLILMRGLPGSGKTFLAQKLKGPRGVVLSTDDYFYRNHRYEFDGSFLGEAHEWNRSRAKTALESQWSPLIIDNTNTQSWEMKPYVSMALKYGYHIKIVEPNTPWKWNVKELVRRNQHGVTHAAITRMKERYEHDLSVEALKKYEGKPDARKTENELTTKKATDVKSYSGGPSLQTSSKQTGSGNAIMRQTESSTVSSNKRTASKQEESGNISSLKYAECVNTPSVDDSVRGHTELSSRRFDRPEETYCKSKTGRSEKSECNSKIHEIVNAGDKGERADAVISSFSPEPQRAPRMKIKRLSNTQQLVTTELSSHDSGNNKSDKFCGTVTSHENHAILHEIDNSSEQNTPKKHSAVFCVEKLSALASLACTRTFSSSDHINKTLEKSQRRLQTVKESKSSLSPPLDSSFVGQTSDENRHYVKCVGEGHEKGERTGETYTGEASKEALVSSTVICDEYLESDKSLPLKNILDDDAIFRGDNTAPSGEMEGKYFPTPPPLSEILVSASRTKLKSRSKSTSKPLQLVTDNVNSLVDNSDQLRSETALEQEVCDGKPDPENRTFDEDVSTDEQNMSDVSCLLDPPQPSSSENPQNQRHAGLEFLKTCFPDVDCDLINAILTAKGGDLTKVVDELLVLSKASSAELSTFPADPLFFASQQEISDSSSYVAQKSSSPTEETMNTASAIQPQSNFGAENNKPPGKLSSQMHLAPKVSSSAQSPPSNAGSSFQLSLEPAVALHLIELFGPFPGVDFKENISQEDLVVAVDSSLARQLYKKWEHTIQTRKGISAANVGFKHKAKRELTVNNQLGGDQISAEGTLREIMDEQLALELSRNLPDVAEQDLAAKLKKQKLFEMFPGIDRVALEEVFQANGYELAPSVEAVKASCNLSSQDAPTTVIASGFSGRLVNQKPTKECPLGQNQTHPRFRPLKIQATWTTALRHFNTTSQGMSVLRKQHWPFPRNRGSWHNFMPSKVICTPRK
ncbi:uncharacterized protein LOC111327618 isoform X3 [Stylophora pistillata]|uniref:uncharacterized protein LOC111327618 isoform X3 n=1 Tax=Stylophora pistillata TaxID=50429 RepID=UPI000C051D0E|nr:uncharacterized protein LOC111327618 isoform X3 [Stylophora pistillata]